jgi:hypothetical protein
MSAVTTLMVCTDYIFISKWHGSQLTFFFFFFFIGNSVIKVFFIEFYTF